MKLVVQRVAAAAVSIEEKEFSRIGKGLAVLLGIHLQDTPEMTMWYVNKLLGLRIFEDDAKKMNLSVEDVRGEVLVVSQFTLYGMCDKGRRPSFTEAAGPEIAEPIYDKFCQEIKMRHGSVKTGKFGAEMQVMLLNDGPVTILL